MEKTAEEKLVPIGALFQHYSGKKYKILSIGRHSENLELYVVYQGLYDCDKFGPSPVWMRPLKMFVESVTIDGKRVPRFAKI